MSVHRRQNKTFPQPLTEISSATSGKFGRHMCMWPLHPPVSHRKSACADRKPHAYVGSSINLQDSPFIVSQGIFVCRVSLIVSNQASPFWPLTSSHQLCACAVWKPHNIISSCEIVSWTLTITLFSPPSDLPHRVINQLCIINITNLDCVTEDMNLESNFCCTHQNVKKGIKNVYRLYNIYTNNICRQTRNNH